jgi:hypothetical protein
MGVSKGKTNMADLKSKFSDVLDEIGIPVQVYIIITLICIHLNYELRFFDIMVLKIIFEINVPFGVGLDQ